MNSRSAADAASSASWPDWSGCIAVIVATGPSAAQAPLDAIEGLARCIAIKSSWRLAPWADVLYGCDRDWWVVNRGAADFRGLKVSPSPTACRVYGLRQVRLRAKAEVLNDKPGVIGCGSRAGGGNSGFQAMNLAVQWGARRIVLVGFDMTLARGAHWHPEHRDLPKPDAARQDGHRAALDAAAAQFKALGVDVVNATPGSALKAYPFRDLLAAIGD